MKRRATLIGFRRLAAYAAACAAITIVVGAARAGAFEREESFQRTIPLDGAKRVVVADSRGDVKVVGEKGRADILCEFTKRIRGRDQEKADRLFALMDIDVRREAAAIVVEARYPDRQDRNKNILSYLMQHFPGMGIDITLTVPAGFDVKIVTSSGDAELANILGSAEISSASGDVEANGVGGDLKIDVSSGDIEVSNVAGKTFLNSASGDIEASALKGDVGVRSASGDIDLSAIGGDLSAGSTSGDVIVDGVQAVVFSGSSGSARFSEVRGSVAVTVSTGDVEVYAVPQAAGNYEVRSSSGTITLQFDRPMKGGYKFKAQTTSGDISINLPIDVSQMGRHRLTGVVRGGKSFVVLETASGDIVVSESEE